MSDKKIMAYHLWDGFDNYSAATELWPTVSGSIQYSSSYARFAAPNGLLGAGMRIPPGGPGWKVWNMVSNQPTMIFGFAVFIPNLGGVGFNRVMQFSDSSTVQCSLCVNNSGQLGLIKSFNGSTLASSALAVVSPGVWHWLDIVVTISSTVGVIQVYLDQSAGSSSLVLNASGLNNQSTGNSYMNQFVIGDFGNTFLGIQFDDFHAHDNTGSAPNSVVGDSRIYTKVASGAGYTTSWAPTGAAANWQCSDEAPPDGDTTYNASNTPGAIDGYAVSTSGLRSHQMVWCAAATSAEMTPVPTLFRMACDRDPRTRLATLSRCPLRMRGPMAVFVM